jgi:hypothetical protein
MDLSMGLARAWKERAEWATPLASFLGLKRC